MPEDFSPSGLGGGFIGTMSVSSTAVATMDYVWLGQPFVRHEPKAAAATQGLDYSFLGQPLVATELAAATTDTEFATTASATSAFVSTTIAAAAASTVIAATVSPLAAATIAVDAAATPALTVDWQAQATATADSTATAALSVAGVSSATAGVDFNTALALVVAAESSNVVSADSSTALTLAALWDGVGSVYASADASASLSLAVAWDVIAQQISSADASSALTLSPSFDSAFSTVIGSTWSTIINPAVGPVQAPVTPIVYGSGYQLNDLLLIVGGNNDATVTVISRSGTGASGLRLQNGGSGYVNGTYTTQAITGTGSGCVVTLLADTAYVKGRSGATKGSVWSPAPTLTTTGRALSFAAATSSTTAAVTADMVSGATAGSVASTVDSAFADWQGLAIGPVDVDFMTYLVSNVSWSGEAIRRLIVAQLRGVASTPVNLKGHQTIIHLRGD